MEPTIDSTAKAAYVKDQACFSQLTQGEITELAELFTEKHFSKDDTIVTEGDPVDSVFIIISGTAEVRHLRILNGDLQIERVATLGPNQAIGLNATGFFSLSGLRTATVVALSDMVTLKLSVAKFHGFELSHSHVYEIMHRQAKREGT